MDLVNRLKFFMDSNKIAISQFADTCTIPRPTMSQILNGRNKKISDELISKIHAAYPQLSVLWLMFGEGEMLVNSNTQISDTQTTSNHTDLEPQMTISEEDTLFADRIYNISENQTEKKHISTNSAAQQSEPISSADESSTNQTASTLTPTITTDPKKSDNTEYDIIDFGYNDRPDEVISSSHNPETSKTTNSQQPSQVSPDTNSQVNLSNSPSWNEKTKESTQNISLKTLAGKHITNIVVFYSDNSFQSFYPEFNPNAQS